jgi:hypothetical protein
MSFNIGYAAGNFNFFLPEIITAKITRYWYPVSPCMGELHERLCERNTARMTGAKKVSSVTGIPEANKQ